MSIWIKFNILLVSITYKLFAKLIKLLVLSNIYNVTLSLI